jgi:hypothetical protein
MTYRKLLLALTALVSTVVIGQVPISGLPPANLPLQTTDKIVVNQTVGGAPSTRAAPLSSLAPFFPSLTSHYLLQAPDATLTQSRTLAGTANQVILTDGGALGNLTLSLPQSIATTSTPTFAGLTLTGPLSGTSGAFSGALSAGSLSLTTPLPATSGGTGFGSYTVGDLLQASTTTALSKLSDVAAGSYLRSGGVGATFAWSTLTLPNAATTGDILYATGANVVGNLPDVTAGSYLRSGGASTVPLYSTVKIPNTDALGDIWVASATNTVTALAGNITTTKNFLTQTGTGAVSASPAWGTIAASDLPGAFSGFANPTGTVGLTAVNGAATTAMRSDAAPPLSQSIVPTWTGVHTFSATPNLNSGFTGTYNLNTTKQNVLSNTSTGTAATHSIGVNNGTDTFQMGLNGVNNVTPFFTGGPASVQGYFGTIGATPLSFGTNGLERFRMTATGGMVMNAPTSGQTLAVTSIANQDALAVVAPNTSGQSFGMIVTAGTTSADESARFRNAGGTTEFLIRGDGVLQGNGPVAATLVDMTPDKGSFTLTYTGFTATVQCTANWNRIGNIVFLNLCAATGTSNTTAMTGTTLPAAIVPAISQAGVVCGSLEDNTTPSGGYFQINAASTTITFGKGLPGAAFTAAGTKGFIAPGCSISYMLNN